MIFMLLFLISHILIYLMLFIMRLSKALKCEYITLFIGFFVPVWGLIMVCQKKNADHKADWNIEGSEIERPLAQEETKNKTLDILYNINKSIVVEEDELKESIVPLEEALVVNDTATKRALIIDVLYSNPTDYISQLYDAKENGDTEVVHYAATALAEIQKEFDLKFHDLMRRQEIYGSDEELENERLLLLEKYIFSGLLTGEALKTQLREYSQMLKKKLESNITRGRWSMLCKKADADIELGDIEALDADVAMMNERWPENESVYLYRISSAVLKKDRAEVSTIIDEIRERKTYLSSDLKSVIRFWETDKRKNEKKIV